MLQFLAAYVNSCTTVTYYWLYSAAGMAYFCMPLLVSISSSIVLTSIDFFERIFG